MEDFIYSVKGIFTDLLDNNSAKKYYIAPYQRGYKWKSKRYGQVPQLLLDVYQAMIRDTDEYYLQYLTLKNTDQQLEVIDGQQRLTTLALIFYVLHDYGVANIAENKINYARYEGGEDIFKKAIKEHSEETQDLFYMSTAVECIHTFFELLKKYYQFNDYQNYLLNHVKLIVNMESEFVPSEDVFANLNDNKVALTDSELIKGLLLTRGVDLNTPNGLKRHYKEILDARTIMGRIWDEINSWIEQPKVKYYFFGSSVESGMYELLLLAKPRNEVASDSPSPKASLVHEFQELLTESSKESSMLYQLFEEYNEAITSYDEATKVFENIKHIYRVFQGIFNDVAEYNTVGYCLFSKSLKDSKNRTQILHRLIRATASEKTDYIHSIIRDRVPDMAKLRKDIQEKNDIEKLLSAYSSLKYRTSNPELTNLLLSFSVLSNGNPYKFDFVEYESSKWSFEHISPQHPSSQIKIHEAAIRIVIKKIDKEIAKEENDIEKKNKLTELTDAIKKNEKIPVDDIVFLYDNDINEDYLHCCGNMALLPSGANSSLNNNPFVAKRPILYSIIRNGNFVPRHTMDIFNKNMNVDECPFTDELSIWTKDDIMAHLHWMEKENAAILNQFKQL
jgi:hypothetical protein